MMNWINKPDKVTRKVAALIDGRKLAEPGRRKGRDIVWYEPSAIRRVNYTDGIVLACVDECDKYGRTTSELIDYSEAIA